MVDELDQTDGIGGRHGTARHMAERAVRAQAAGENEEAERLFTEAGRIDPEAVSAVLAERAADPVADPTADLGDGATGADAGPQDDREIAAMSRTVEPGSDAPPRAGITGPGSGGDQQGT